MERWLFVLQFAHVLILQQSGIESARGAPVDQGGTRPAPVIRRRRLLGPEPGNDLSAALGYFLEFLTDLKRRLFVLQLAHVSILQQNGIESAREAPVDRGGTCPGPAIRRRRLVGHAGNDLSVALGYFLEFLTKLKRRLFVSQLAHVLISRQRDFEMRGPDRVLRPWNAKRRGANAARELTQRVRK